MSAGDQIRELQVKLDQMIEEEDNGKRARSWFNHEISQICDVRKRIRTLSNQGDFAKKHVVKMPPCSEKPKQSIFSVYSSSKE